VGVVNGETAYTGKGQGTEQDSDAGVGSNSCFATYSVRFVQPQFGPGTIFGVIKIKEPSTAP